VTEQPLWAPDQARIASANMTRFARAAITRWKLDINTWPAFYQWSVDVPEQFWSSLWDFGGVIASVRGERVVANGNKMPGARFFPDAKINFAQNLLRRRDDGIALVFWGENRVKRHLTYAALNQQVSRVTQALVDAGVKEGDRVAAYLPNMPEAIVGMLAAASLGAIWSSCSPDFGVQGVLDRFGQIEPVVLFAVDGYYYNGKTISCIEKVKAIAAALPSLKKTVLVSYVDANASTSGIAHGVRYADFTAMYWPRELVFMQLPFNHPLYILYSSGTTGVPKCIVHGAGGTLLKHLQEHLLCWDIKPDDRLFYFTTCGWVMWNWLASALASGATLLLYDGSPSLYGGRILFDYADAEGMTHFGTSPRFIDSLRQQPLTPPATHKLVKLRTVISTGSPLAPENFDYVYQHIKADVSLASMSGGTDLMGAFAGGNPIMPVWRGEIQSLIPGMKVEVFDDAGKPLPAGRKGELVCTRAFPSMPIGFWNDPGDKAYRAAYFEKFPNVWAHGDWCEITAHGGMLIYGRSDAVLNPGGVRIGTAEIYRQVEHVSEVLESLAIGQDWPPGRQGDVRVVLFVRLRDGVALDAALVDKIKQQIRANTTPRHVPARVLQVADIPRTRTNKIVELAVRHVVHGRAVKNLEALANPEALEHFRNRAELQS
jgi:acetoacetyl-CoA synthetase